MSSFTFSFERLFRGGGIEFPINCPTSTPDPSSFKMLLHCLLTLTASDEKSWHNPHFFLYLSSLSSGCFLDFIPFSVNLSLILLWVGVVFFMIFCAQGSFGSLDQWVYNLHYDWKICCHCFFKNCFFSMVSSWTSITHILDLLKLPYHSLTRCSIKKHFFFFFTVSFILGIFNCSGFMFPNLFFFFSCSV